MGFGTVQLQQQLMTNGTVQLDRGEMTEKKSLTLMHSLLDLRFYITVVSSQIILSTKE